MYEQGLRSFVSFVHFYYKHECKFIFQPKGTVSIPNSPALGPLTDQHSLTLLCQALDLVGTAKTFALLHLPKMPELKSVDTSTFEPYPVDPSTIPYHSKAKEKQSMSRGVREKGEGRRERGRGKGRKRGKMTLPWHAGPVMKRNKASAHVKVRVINNIY